MVTEGKRNQGSDEGFPGLIGVKICTDFDGESGIIYSGLHRRFVLTSQGTVSVFHDTRFRSLNITAGGSVSRIPHSIWAS